MALIVVMLAWMGPTRMIRAQVLSMRERMFVNVAKLSGMSNIEIIFKEIMPNLLPFLGSAMVGQIFGAIFASFGLSVLGLGPAARTADWQHDLLCAVSGLVFQRLVVVAAVAQPGVDPDLRRADVDHGRPGRRSPTHACGDRSKHERHHRIAGR